jgi:hypothetical protein
MSPNSTVASKLKLRNAEVRLWPVHAEIWT